MVKIYKYTAQVEFLITLEPVATGWALLAKSRAPECGYLEFHTGIK